MESRTRKPRYNRVQALLLSWQEDDEQDDDDIAKKNKMIDEEVLAVQGLFQKKLNFSVERCSIPVVDKKSKKPVYSHNELSGRSKILSMIWISMRTRTHFSSFTTMDMSLTGMILSSGTRKLHHDCDSHWSSANL